MNFILSVVIAILFGAGFYLMLKRDLIRLVVGISLISNAVNLFIIAAGLFRGEAPIYPLSESGVISDPLVQALALTAIVISFGVLALVLSLVYRIYTTHETLDQEDLRDAELSDIADLEREAGIT